MARTNSRQRAYDAVKLFEGMGKTVKSITFLKGGEFKLEFVTEEQEEQHEFDNIDWSAAEREANSLDSKDFKLGKPEKKAPRGSRQALKDRLANEKNKNA